MREERKQELEEHVEAVNRALREVEDFAPGGLDSDDDDAWGGIPEEKEKLEEVLDHEEEYVDEDRYTTVTIEAVDVSKEGLLKVGDDSDDAPELVYAEKGKEDDGKKKWPKKVRKKKFTYESKAERKFTRGKQKAGNKAKADARKGKE